MAERVDALLVRMTLEEKLGQLLAAAVRAAAAGGGFTLCLTGHAFGPWDFGTRSNAAGVIRNVEAYIDAALEFGGGIQS